MWKACMSESNITGVFKGIAQCGYDFLTLQNFHLKNDVENRQAGIAPSQYLGEVTNRQPTLSRQYTF